MPGRITIDPKALRLIKQGLIVVGRKIRQHQPISLANRSTAEVGILSRGSHEMAHRIGPADRLVDKVIGQFWPRPEFMHLTRALTQAPDRPRDGRGCRLVSRRYDD